MSRHWTLEDIAWNDFDASKVDPDILCAVKAAALVEFNAPDYVTYLCNVFSDRPDLKAIIHQWGREEVQHGQALARWAELADPTFVFDDAFTRFREGYSIPLDSIESNLFSSRLRPMSRRMNSSTTSFSMIASTRWKKKSQV